MIIKNPITAVQYISHNNCIHFFNCKESFRFSFPSIFSLHFSTNLSSNFVLHLQFSYSKYSPTSLDLSQSYSQY